jgi:CTP:molybdopterin cytidylyltransferase MocA
VGGRTFLDAAVESLRAGGCDPVVVVAGEDAVVDAARSAGAGTVRNEASSSEQIDSIRLGLGALGDGVTAAVVLPVDHPLVSPETVAALTGAHSSRTGAVIRPVHEGRAGHPTLFPRSVWTRLSDAALPRGARSVVEAPDIDTVDLPVDDPGVLADIDTPRDYHRHVGDGP